MTPRPPPRSAQKGWVITQLRGVPIEVSPSWVLAGVLLCGIYGPVLRDAVPGASASTAYASAFGFAVLFGVCVLAHEAGHTLVSIKLGHPVHRIVLFALGGVSEIIKEPQRPRDELLIAASGPLVSVAVAAGSWFAYDAAPAGHLVTALLGLLFWSNAGLAAFNLLPGLPLDGGRVLRAAVMGLGVRALTATRVAAWSGRLIAVALFLLGFLINRSTPGIAGGLFTAAIAAYLWFGAGRAVELAKIVDRVPGLTVERLLRPGIFVPTGLTVAEALDRAWGTNARGLVLVDAADRPTAIVDEARIGAVPPERRAWTPVTSVARPLEDGLTIDDDLDGDALLERMRATPASEYLVLHTDGTPAGIISARDLLQQLKGTT